MLQLGDSPARVCLVESSLCVPGRMIEPVAYCYHPSCVHGACDAENTADVPLIYMDQLHDIARACASVGVRCPRYKTPSPTYLCLSQGDMTHARTMHEFITAVHNMFSLCTW